MKITNRKEELKEEIKVAQQALKENLSKPELIGYFATFLGSKDTSDKVNLPSSHVIGAQSDAIARRDIKNYIQMLLD